MDQSYLPVCLLVDSRTFLYSLIRWTIIQNKANLKKEATVSKKKEGTRQLLAGIGIVSLLFVAAVGADTVIQSLLKPDENTSEAMIVYKSPTCGCCSLWIDHVNANEFKTESRDITNLTQIKQELGVAPRYQSCHTAIHPSGLVFEGHVPAEAMKRIIDNPIDDTLGLAVPGMPIGSPGMEYGNRIDPYEIKLMLRDGSTRIYATVDQSGITFQN